jgi:GAF domain-containing protein
LTLVKDLQEKLERTTRDVDLYTKMTHLLQSCKTVDESIPIISATMQQLFAAVSGRCFLLNSSDNLMEEVAVWGGESPANVSIIPDDCWALRRGHIHEIGIDQNSINPPCNYLQSKNKPYMCIPLMAQGAVLGVIHLIFEGTAVDLKHIRHSRRIVEAASDSISEL